MIQTLLVLIGGTLVVLFSWFLAQGALRAETRIERIFYAVCVAISLLVGLYILFSRPIALLGFLLACGIIAYLKKRSQPDIIIGESLLPEAVSPELGAELEELGTQVLKGNLEEAASLDLKDDLVDIEASKRLSD